LDGLVENTGLKDKIQEVLDGLLSYGDLQEHLAEPSEGSTKLRLIFATPPTFVRYAGSIYLLGLVPEQPSMLTRDLESKVIREGYVRRIADPKGYFADIVQNLGIEELKHDLWLWTPDPETAERYRSRFDLLLDRAKTVANVEGLEILDSQKPTSYYRGRWSQPKSHHNGRYISRRTQRYGAPLWSYIEIESGRPLKLIDLHLEQETKNVAPWDKAWRLQAAIDNQLGHPQSLLYKSGTAGHDRLNLFAPPPGWLQRRWGVLGSQVPREKGALFTFEFSRDVAEEEARFAKALMWYQLERQTSIPEASDQA
jgi:hypothetical protein